MIHSFDIFYQLCFYHFVVLANIYMLDPTRLTIKATIAHVFFLSLKLAFSYSLTLKKVLTTSEDFSLS